MTNTKQSLCLLFSAPLQTFCGAVVLHAQRAAYCVPFRFACAGNSESGMVHSIRFHGFRYVRIRFSRSFVTQHPRAAVLDC